MSVATSEIGTKRTSGDVCYLVANGGKPDIVGTARFGRERPGVDETRKAVACLPSRATVSCSTNAPSITASLRAA
jgi:hypothetical protein